ncbi:MAG: hypothetical protein AB8V23_04295, partial [Candidatus Midichloria sp.]
TMVGGIVSAIVIVGLGIIYKRLQHVPHHGDAHVLGKLVLPGAAAGGAVMMAQMARDLNDPNLPGAHRQPGWDSSKYDVNTYEEVDEVLYNLDVTLNKLHYEDADVSVINDDSYITPNTVNYEENSS